MIAWPTVFCAKCYTKQHYRVREEMQTAEVRGISFTYPELQAICTGCGDKIYSPQLNDINCHRREQAYYKKIEEMKESDISNGEGFQSPEFLSP